MNLGAYYTLAAPTVLGVGLQFALQWWVLALLTLCLPGVFFGLLVLQERRRRRR